LGFSVGAVIYGLLYPHVMPQLTSIANYGATSLPQLFNLSPWLTALVFVQGIVLLLYVLEKKNVRRREKMETGD
jgi:uncharacterized membrane protein YkvI